MAPERSARRVEMMYSVLRIAVNRSLRLGLVKHNAATLVDFEVEPNSRVGEAVTPDQAADLLDATRAYPTER